MEKLIQEVLTSKAERGIAYLSAFVAVVAETVRARLF